MCNLKPSVVCMLLHMATSYLHCSLAKWCSGVWTCWYQAIPLFCFSNDAQIAISGSLEFHIYQYLRDYVFPGIF